MSKFDIQEMITNRMVQALDKGKIPWKKPWSTMGVPMNYVSKKPYQGINVFLLAIVASDETYFLTFNQIKQLKGHLKSGSEGIPVVYWDMRKITDKNEKGETIEKTIPFMKYYTVFKLYDTEGIARPEIKEGLSEVDRISNAEKLVKGTGATIEYKTQDRAYYSPSDDKITMPDIQQFKNASGLYSTLLHELTHWTGHKSRLNRLTECASFGTEDYSKEELVAELGSAFMCAELGIDNNNTLENSEAYIQSWSKVLRNDKGMIISASSKAKKAVDYIKGENK